MSVELDSSQRAVVEADPTERLLVIAGAGRGKKCGALSGLPSKGAPDVPPAAARQDSADRRATLATDRT